MNTLQTAKTALEKSDSSLVSSLRALPPAAWILFLGMFLNKFGAFVVPFLALYLTRLGFTLADAGLAIGAYGVGNLVASFLGGHLADTIGRRKTILLSMFCGAGTLLLLSQARALPEIIALAGLAGLAGEFYRPACSALLTDLVPPHQRVTAFAAYRMSFNAGWAFGPATAGFLATKGFFWLFVGDAATSALFGLVAWLALPKDTHRPRSDNGWSEAIRVVRRDRNFHQIILASLFVAFVFMQMSSTFSVHVTQLGFSAVTYGALISLNGALVVLCELPLTTLTRRFPARRVLAVGYALIGAGFALNAWARTVPELAVCIIIFTLGEMVAIPVSSAVVANLAPAHLRGRYMGMYGLSFALALIIGPGLGLKLLALNPTALWLGCGALGLLGAAIISKESKAAGVAFGPEPVTKAAGSD
jgi:MFS family permease